MRIGGWIDRVRLQAKAAYQAERRVGLYYSADSRQSLQLHLLQIRGHFVGFHGQELVSVVSFQDV